MSHGQVQNPSFSSCGVEAVETGLRLGPKLGAAYDTLLKFDGLGGLVGLLELVILVRLEEVEILLVSS